MLRYIEMQKQIERDRCRASINIRSIAADQFYTKEQKQELLSSIIEALNDLKNETINALRCVK